MPIIWAKISPKLPNNHGSIYGTTIKYFLYFHFSVKNKWERCQFIDGKHAGTSCTWEHFFDPSVKLKEMSEYAVTCLVFLFRVKLNASPVSFNIQIPEGKNTAAKTRILCQNQAYFYVKINFMNYWAQKQSK